MERLTAANLVSFIDKLKKNQRYQYINSRNNGLIKIIRINKPEGPIVIKRWDPSKSESEDTSREESISVEMIWRLANAFVPEQPINVDRILGASYNTRSVLETLLAHTPEFYFSYPGRYEIIGNRTTVKRGHKHLIWCPRDPHVPGILQEKTTNTIISELPLVNALYDNLDFSPSSSDIDEEISRTHSLMQVSLMVIGQQLYYRTWIAANDRGIVYQGKKIIEHEGVISKLGEERLLLAYPEAAKAANLIDCVWFKNGKLMPAVIEVEHSTGVTSGLSRMKEFKDKFIPIKTRYVIVAPDEDRDKVIQEANKPQFSDLDTRYFPYSSVKELYSLCRRRKLKGITEEFLDCFMEKVVM
jgi:type II restriction enzyme